jgi:toxin ParE1/3/4
MRCVGKSGNRKPVPELVISPLARRDIADQAAYYHDQGTPATSDRWLVKIRKAFRLLAARPGMGELIRPGLRAWRVEKFKQHVVIYRATPTRVEIVRVVHGAADLDSALGS